MKDKTNAGTPRGISTKMASPASWAVTTETVSVRYVGEAMRAGETLSVPDIDAHPGLNGEGRLAYRRIDVAAFAVVSLIKDAENVAGMVLHQVAAATGRRPT